jgi:hypothetical protein
MFFPATARRRVAFRTHSDVGKPPALLELRPSAAEIFLWCVSPPTGRAAGPPFSGTRIVEWPAQTALQGQTAYAFILLRAQGYPCIFYGDYYGIEEQPERPAQPAGKNYLTCC